MAFMNLGLLRTLNATSGAFSIVTNREATGDRSITLDRYEKEVMAEKYDLTRIVRKGSYIEEARSERLKFITFTDYQLNNFEYNDIPIVYPKESGNEIRLYMQGRLRFQGNTNDVFLIFNRQENDVPIIGFLSPLQWEQLLRQAERNFILYEQDHDDDVYLKNIVLQQAGQAVPFSSYRFQRNYSLALQALENANFKCEYNPEHITFISPITQKSFMEAHHLIPLAFQKNHIHSLDNIGNIYSLCPICHRAIHYGDSQTKRIILEKLYYSRNMFFENQLGTDFGKLCFYYGI